MLRTNIKQKRQISKPKTNQAKETPVNESNENIKIFLRVKPQPSNHSSTIRIINQNQVEIVPPIFSTQQDRVYNYQQVFKPETSNLEVFQNSMIEPINNLLSGYNAALFVYGMTGAGKTHTMFNSSHNVEHKGLVDMTLTRIFEQLEQKNKDKYEVHLSFFEIYNENIRDLLSEKKQNLNIMDDAQQGVVIPELKEIKVQKTEKAHKFIRQGMTRRVREATHHNHSSSRSHAILQITLRRYVSQQGELSLQESKLFMVDLAGNEKTSQNQTKRFLEGVNINKSLLTLGKCISILAEPKKGAFIPYRDSKLTRILKQALGGNSKTVMIACVSPAVNYYEETLNTLKYSSKAKQIKNKVKMSSMKKISKDKQPKLEVEMKIQEKMGLRLDEQQQILSLVNDLEILLTEKIKAENIKEELEQCLLQQPPNSLKVKELRQTVLKLNRRIQNINGQFECHIGSIISTVSEIKKQQQENNRALLKQINILNHQLQQSHSKVRGKQAKQIITEPADQVDSNSNILPVCMSEEILPECKPQISIKVQSYKQNNKENICINRLKRSSTSRSSFNSHSSLSQKSSQAIFKPMLTEITKDHFKLQSPTHRDPILIRSQSQHDSLTSSKAILHQMDKNPSNFTSFQVAGLLDQFERQQYEISIPQKSMISKLRFLLKNSQKQNENTRKHIQPKKKTLIL